VIDPESLERALRAKPGSIYSRAALNAVVAPSLADAIGKAQMNVPARAQFAERAGLQRLRTIDA